MKLLNGKKIYVPLYRANQENFDVEYDELMRLYHKSFNVQSNDFQSLYDALTIQLMYWISDFEENINEQIKEKIEFEINGLDFYKFFYNSFEWYPSLIVDTYDGIILNDESITEIVHHLNSNEIEFKLEFGGNLILSENYFLEVFKKNDLTEIHSAIYEMTKTKKLYFDCGLYYFINEMNYKKLMLYMNEQIKILNEIYRELNLREIFIVTN